jgi:tetratricopeptide (TPR) repeat protein
MSTQGIGCSLLGGRFDSIAQICERAGGRVVRRVTREDAERLVALADEVQLTGPEAERWAVRLAPERDALAGAVDWLMAAGRGDDAARLAAVVWRLWMRTGDLEGGRGLLARALDVAGARPTKARSLALYADGLLAFRQGRQDQSRARNEEALEVARAAGDAEAESLALVGLSRVAFRDGDNDRVRELARQARGLAAQFGGSAEVAPLHMLAAGTRLSGDYDTARLLYLESAELNRRLGDTYMVGVELHNLLHVEIHRGELGEATCLYEAVHRLRSGSSDPYDEAMDLLNRAALAAAHGEPGAADLLARAQRVLDDAGIALDPDDRFEVDELRRQLGG